MDIIDIHVGLQDYFSIESRKTGRMFKIAYEACLLGIGLLQISEAPGTSDNLQFCKQNRLGGAS